MLRYFVAIPLSNAVRDRLGVMTPTRLAGMRRVATDSMHLTLHFLGELSEANLKVTGEALGTVVSPAFALTIAGAGTFPSHGSPRVLWAGVIETPPLHQLHQAIARTLETAIGFQAERRRYSPHITLGRWNRPVSSYAADEFLQAQRDFVLPPMPVTHFALYSSQLRPSGPLYREEGSYPLQPAAE